MREPSSFSSTLSAVDRYVQRIADVDSSAMTYAMEGYLRLEWVDARLAFNESLGSHMIYDDPGKDVWLPDIYWEEFHHSAFSDSGEAFRVNSTGGVWWSRHGRLVLKCPDMDFAMLPFDHQSCNYTAGSYVDTADEVLMVWKWPPFLRGTRPCQSEWHAYVLDASNVTLSFDSGSWSYASARIGLSRNPLPHMLNGFFLTICFVLCSYCGFWLDPLSTPARVTLSVVTMLTVTNRYMQLISSLPSDAQMSAWLPLFNLVSFAFNLIAFLEQVAVNVGWEALKYIQSVEDWERVERAALEKRGVEWSPTKRSLRTAEQAIALGIYDDFMNAKHERTRRRSGGLPPSPQPQAAQLGAPAVRPQQARDLPAPQAEGDAGEELARFNSARRLDEEATNEYADREPVQPQDEHAGYLRRSFGSMLERRSIALRKLRWLQWLTQLRNLDHYFRWLFLLAYSTFVAVMLGRAEVYKQSRGASESSALLDFCSD